VKVIKEYIIVTLTSEYIDFVVDLSARMAIPSFGNISLLNTFVPSELAAGVVLFDYFLRGMRYGAIRIKGGDLNLTFKVA
jgi:hypothetical protein